VKKYVATLALIPLVFGAAALAADKKASSESPSVGSLSDAGRGGLSEWPVSQEEANWISAAPASTGSSSGTSGSDLNEKNR
jgi:hypothetical protein